MNKNKKNLSILEKIIKKQDKRTELLNKRRVERLDKRTELSDKRRRESRCLVCGKKSGKTPQRNGEFLLGFVCVKCGKKYGIDICWNCGKWVNAPLRLGMSRCKC